MMISGTYLTGYFRKQLVPKCWEKSNNQCMMDNLHISSEVIWSLLDAYAVYFFELNIFKKLNVGKFKAISHPHLTRFIGIMAQGCVVDYSSLLVHIETIQCSRGFEPDTWCHSKLRCSCSSGIVGESSMHGPAIAMHTPTNRLPKYYVIR